MKIYEKKLDRKLRIEVNPSEDEITFSDEQNDNKVIYKLKVYHDQDCCENVYADLEYLEKEMLQTEGNIYADLISIIAERDSGFRIKFEENGNYFFVPCYDEQNGYYSANLYIQVYSMELIKIDTIDIRECAEYKETW